LHGTAKSPGYGNGLDLPALAIVPWIAYARSLLEPHRAGKECDRRSPHPAGGCWPTAGRGGAEHGSAACLSAIEAIRAKGGLPLRLNSGCGIGWIRVARASTYWIRGLATAIAPTPVPGIPAHLDGGSAMAWRPMPSAPILGYATALISTLHAIGVGPAARTFSGFARAQGPMSRGQRSGANAWPSGRQLASLLDTGDSTGRHDRRPCACCSSPTWGFDQVKSPAEIALYPPL